MTDIDPIAALRFEEAYTRLEATLDELRQDGLPLDRALALYEEGTRLAAHCERLLSQAELRVTELTPSEGELARDEAFVRVVRETEIVAQSEW